MQKNIPQKQHPKELIYQVILDYKDHVRTAKQLSEYYDVSYNAVKYWVRKYNRSGLEAFMPKKEKVMAITELRQKYSLNQLLKIAGLARSTYYYVSGTLQKEDKHIEHKKLIQRFRG